jgi:recombinational DNA repair protein (RecF pathway)
MHEYQSNAVVLDAEPVGEADMRFSLYTERFGRIIARGKSSRKITGKLAPHLQVGDVAAVRIVEKNGLRLADALKERRVRHLPSNLVMLNRLLHDAERDNALWNMLLQEAYDWRVALRVLGWDPTHASCAKCGGHATFFFVQKQEFACRAHASQLPPDAVLSVA